MGLLVRPVLLSKAAGGGGGGGPAYRYYRIEALTQVYNGVQWHIQVSEIELRLSSGGADETGSGTASASSYYSTYLPSKAVDDDTNTFWSCYNPSSQTTEWWQYDFGAGNAKAITHIHITPRQYAGTEHLCFTDFTVKGSDDGSSWDTLATGLKSGGWSSMSGEEFQIQ